MSRAAPKSGGIFLPIGIFAGLAVGFAAGQPIIGLLAGTACGIAAAAWVWIRDSNRSR